MPSSAVDGVRVVLCGCLAGLAVAVLAEPVPSVAHRLLDRADAINRRFMADYVDGADEALMSAHRDAAVVAAATPCVRRVCRMLSKAF